jgi:Nucleotidyltransferase
MPAVLRLSDLMNEVVAIHGRGNFPTLEVKLGKALVQHGAIA